MKLRDAFLVLSEPLAPSFLTNPLILTDRNGQHKCLCIYLNYCAHCLYPTGNTCKSTYHEDYVKF